MTWKGIVGQGFKGPEFQAYVHEHVNFGSWRPSFVVVHNTGAPLLSSVWHSVSGQSRMRGLEHYYRDQKGWSAGPHLFVADDLIWVFTPLTVQGVHSPSWNHLSWGVEMVGDYTEEPLNEKVYENTIEALAVLHHHAGIDTATIRFHKEDPATTHKGCPGVNVHKGVLVSAVHNKVVELSGKGEHLADRKL